MPPDLRKARDVPADYTSEDRPYTAEQKADWDREHVQHLIDEATRHSACESAVILWG